MKVYLDDGAIMPTRAHSTDAGLDLYAREFYILPGWDCAIIDTGVHVEIPAGHYGKIESKSGLNVKYSVVSCGGVIDEGYTGSIVVKLYNLDALDYQIKPGDKVAQLVIQPCRYFKPEQVDGLDKFAATERGTDGFGSTGR